MGAGEEDGSAGRAQHAGVAQVEHCDSERQQAREPEAKVEPSLAETGKSPCQARTRPSKKTTAVFPNRDVMFRYWSFRPSRTASHTAT
jgi:hypothetical protein